MEKIKDEELTLDVVGKMVQRMQVTIVCLQNLSDIHYAMPEWTKKLPDITKNGKLCLNNVRKKQKVGHRQGRREGRQLGLPEMVALYF